MIWGIVQTLAGNSTKLQLFPVVNEIQKDANRIVVFINLREQVWFILQETSMGLRSRAQLKIWFKKRLFGIRQDSHRREPRKVFEKNLL